MEFQYGPDFDVTPEVKKAFDDNGFIIVRGLMDNEETAKIKKSLEEYGLVQKYSYGLMGGDEMYHYHTKIMMKDPKIGGSFEWHQDYGYWYQNGNLAPDLISMFLAVDPCVKENGGLQVLVGSHKCGRVDHHFESGQQGADLERVEHIKKRYQHMYVNLQPGDALLFHCNLLHSSGPNDSEQRRWAFNCSFNKKSNDPVKKHHHPCYTKLNKVPNSAIRECENFTDFTGKDFVDPASDETVKAGSKSWEEEKEPAST